ncbi:MAG: reverse transcriptase domain-containing protein [Geodermatophilaceae bacterium]
MGRERRVLKIQTKLHRWARDDPHRRFDDLFNLVADPAFLVGGLGSGAREQGCPHGRGGRAHCPRPSRSGRASRSSSTGCGRSLKDRSFRPLPVRERMIPKAGGKLRRSGDPDRGRPGGPGQPETGVGADLRGGLPTRAPTGSAPSAGLTTRSPRCATSHAPTRYEWVVEGDIKACFDEIDHTGPDGPGAATSRGQTRPGPGEGVPEGGDPRLEEQSLEETTAGTPQGGILSPLLANVALSVLDEFIAQQARRPGSDSN